MIKTRTITLSLTAVTLSACAQSAYEASAVTRQDTNPYAVATSVTTPDLQDQRLAQLDSEIYALSSSYAAAEISEEDFANRLAAIEAERAGLEQVNHQQASFANPNLDAQSARSTISLL